MPHPTPYPGDRRSEDLGSTAKASDGCRFRCRRGHPWRSSVHGRARPTLNSWSGCRVRRERLDCVKTDADALRRLRELVGYAPQTVPSRDGRGKSLRYRHPYGARRARPWRRNAAGLAPTLRSCPRATTLVASAAYPCRAGAASASRSGRPGTDRTLDLDDSLSSAIPNRALITRCGNSGRAYLFLISHACHGARRISNPVLSVGRSPNGNHDALAAGAGLCDPVREQLAPRRVVKRREQRRETIRTLPAGRPRPPGQGVESTLLRRSSASLSVPAAHRASHLPLIFAVRDRPQPYLPSLRR